MGDQEQDAGARARGQTGRDHSPTASGHPHATSESVPLERLAPERVIVLPRDSSPAFHGEVVCMCRDTGLSPTMVEVGEARIEHVLLAVAAGAGIALLPESAAERHVVPGVRFVVLDHAEPAFESAVLTLPGSNDTLAIARFVHAVARASRPAPVAAPSSLPAVRLAA